MPPAAGGSLRASLPEVHLPLAQRSLQGEKTHAGLNGRPGCQSLGRLVMRAACCVAERFAVNSVTMSCGSVLARSLQACWNRVYSTGGDYIMKKLLALCALACAATLGHTADDKKELTPQQALMKRCQADATASGNKGKDRQAEVNTCLADGKKRQQEKMKVCAAENKGKKGEEYKAAQKACLAKT